MKKLIVSVIILALLGGVAYGAYRVYANSKAADPAPAAVETAVKTIAVRAGGPPYYTRHERLHASMEATCSTYAVEPLEGESYYNYAGNAAYNYATVVMPTMLSPSPEWNAHVYIFYYDRYMSGADTVYGSFASTGKYSTKVSLGDLSKAQELLSPYLADSVSSPERALYIFLGAETYGAVSSLFDPPESYEQYYHIGIVGLETDTLADVNAYDCAFATYKVTETLPLPTPEELEGHTFAGWYLDQALTQPYDGRPVTSDLRLYAKYTVNQYSVTFDSAGGAACTSVTADYNTTPELPAPTRTGYTFLGWYTADGTAYPADAKLKADVQLVAHWEIIRCTVTLIVNGEVWKTITVDYGTTLSQVEQAQNVQASSVTLAQGLPTYDGADLLLTADAVIELSAASAPGTTDQIVEKVKPYGWYILGAAVLLVVLAIVLARPGKSRRRGRR